MSARSVSNEMSKILGIFLNFEIVLGQFPDFEFVSGELLSTIAHLHKYQMVDLNYKRSQINLRTANSQIFLSFG